MLSLAWNDILFVRLKVMKSCVPCNLHVYTGEEYVTLRPSNYLKLNFFLWSRRRNLQFGFHYRTGLVRVFLRKRGFANSWDPVPSYSGRGSAFARKMIHSSSTETGFSKRGTLPSVAHTTVCIFLNRWFSGWKSGFSFVFSTSTYARFLHCVYKRCSSRHFFPLLLCLLWRLNLVDGLLED